MVCPRGTPRLGCGHGMGRCVTLAPGLPVSDSWVPRVFVCVHCGTQAPGTLRDLYPYLTLCECGRVHTCATSPWGHSDCYSSPRVLAGISTPEAGNNGDSSLNRGLLWCPISRPAPSWLPDLGQEECDHVSTVGLGWRGHMLGFTHPDLEPQHPPTKEAQPSHHQGSH